MVSYFFFP